MRNRNLIILMAVLVISSLGMSKLKSSQTTEPDKDNNVTKKAAIVTNVDQILMNPSQFTDYIAVEGYVAMVDESKSMFGLGCRDGCLILPVNYDEDLPDENQEVVVHGVVKKIEGKGYVFEAEKVMLK